MSLFIAPSATTRLCCRLERLAVDLRDLAVISMVVAEYIGVLFPRAGETDRQRLL